jgi:hypothetical protein
MKYERLFNREVAIEFRFIEHFSAPAQQHNTFGNSTQSNSIHLLIVHHHWKRDYKLVCANFRMTCKNVFTHGLFGE